MKITANLWGYFVGGNRIQANLIRNVGRLELLSENTIINLMLITSQKLAIPFLTLGLLAFVSLSIFGLGHMNGMIKDENGDMAGCIFAGETVLCKMTVIEHISLWQSMFTAMPQENLILLVLLILLVAVIFVTKNILVPPHLTRREALTKRFYLREHPGLLLFNLLREAFSQGILNPKIYDLVAL